MSGQPRRKVKAVASGLLWHAVLSSPPVEWQQLSAITRGIADEILRRLDHENSIVCAPGKSVYDAVCHAIAAHPRERRRVNEAMDELVAARWAAVLPDRFVAHFPDLGGARPTRDGPEREHTRSTLEAHPEHTPSTHEANVADSQESDIGNRGEEKRTEERRVEETARAIEEVVIVRDPMVWTPTSAMLRAEFKKHGIVFTDLVGPSWTKVVNWTLDFSEAIGKPGSYVIMNLAIGFARNEKARLHGYPLSYVVTNPRQFYEAGVALTGEVVFENEENPF